MPRRTRNAEFGASDAPVSTWSVADRVDQVTPTRNDAGQDIAVAGQVLRRRFDDEIGSQLERPAEIRRREGVVDDVHGAVAMGDLGESGVVGNDDRRVGDRLGVQDPGRGRGEGRLDRIRVAHVDIGRRDPEPSQDVAEQCPRRPVRGARGHDAIAGRDERDHGGMDRRHARREGVAGLGALELRDRGGQRGDRRVVDPAVRVARLLVGQDGARARRRRRSRT